MTTRCIFFIAITAFVSSLAMRAEAQIAPPYLTSVSPTGAQRGRTVTFTIDGYNLSGATEVLWSRPGIRARILLNAETAREAPRPSTDPTKRYQGDRGTRNRLQIEAVIAPEAEVGLYRYRLRTPLGTTNPGTIYVGEFREMAEREANDALADAPAIAWPATIVGEMQALGDADSFRFRVDAGQQLVFEVVASALGSKLDSVLTLYDAAGKALASNHGGDFLRDALLAYRFDVAGEYAIRLTDYQKQGMGRASEFGYRLNIGPPAPALANAPAYNPPRLAEGVSRIEESADAKSLARPQAVAWPAAIDGRLAGSGEDWYRFRARKGQAVWIEVGAQRYGSPLDSVIEVYDGAGRLVPRAVLRAELETTQTLNDRDSASRGIRILSWNGIHADDYLLVGNELLQVDVLPKGPDEDIFFKSFAGQRLGFLDTTPEAHAVNTTLYKVSIHPPGTPLPSNGLPQTTLFFRNDDGGPMYGKDSRLTFTAPADGEYTVRVRDVRGLRGEAFAYRLTIREPRPDFELSVDPENPNVPRGASLPVNVTAFRKEGFDGEIEIALRDVPAGFTATSGVIPRGVNTVTLLLTASRDVAPDASFPLRVEGSATIEGRRLLRAASLNERLAVASVAAPPELLVWTDPPQVTLEPGGTAWVSIRVKREQEFKGRIPFDVRNLPHGVIVKDVGLSGVLITEDETTQRFELSAEPWTAPQSRPVLVIGRIETASPQRAEFPAVPFTLTIPPPKKESTR